jgi:hypothetical protein
VGCSKPRRLHAISARVGGGTLRRPGTVGLCCRLRRHNPGCMRMRQQMMGSCQIAGCGRDEWVTRAFCRRRGSGGQLRHSTDACRDPLSSRPEASMWRRRALGDDDPSLISLPCSSCAPVQPPLPAASVSRRAAHSPIELRVSHFCRYPEPRLQREASAMRCHLCVGAARAMWRRCCIRTHCCMPLLQHHVNPRVLAGFQRKASSTLASRAHELSI